LIVILTIAFLLVPVAAQKLTAFDAPSASSVYSTESFWLDVATHYALGAAVGVLCAAKAFC
jgi:hypothetical protein